ncbi:MAG: DNA cytosine methyltransferase [Anaerovoracaceae bacterium]
MHCTKDITGTLRAQEHGHQPLIMAAQQSGAEAEGTCPTIPPAAATSVNNQPILFDNHAKDCRYTGPLEVAPTVTSTYGTGGNNVPLVGDPVAQETICIAGNTIDREPENGGNGLGCQADISYTITTSDRHAVFSRQRSDEFSENHVIATQSARQHKDATDLVCQPEIFGQSQYGNYAEGCATLCAQGGNNGGGSENLVKENKRKLIRRLTPLECERLQGFPDGWTLIPGASDSARYKALGNSVAIPCVDFVLRGIAYFLRKLYEEQEESSSCTSTPTT